MRKHAVLHRESGVARVSVVWLISLGVLFLAALAFAIVTSQDLANAQSARDAAVAQRVEADAKFQTESDKLTELVRPVGWFPEETALPRTDLQALQDDLATLRDTFGLGDDIDTIQEALAAATSAYEQRGREIADRDTRIQTLQGEVQAANRARQTVEAQKNQQIADLRQQLADAEQAATDRQTELEDRLTRSQQQTNDLQREKLQVQADMGDVVKQKDQFIRDLEARIASMGRKLAFLDEPNADQPDGEVLAVLDGVGWIDLGAQQRLALGTRFRVETGTPGSSRVKASAEVIDVEAERAKVLFYNVVDRYDPVVPGDVLINPVYDPQGTRYAVLAGSFSGAYGRPELELYLANMGVVIQDELDLHTDYLIVGNPVYVEDEEEPTKVEDLEEYKEASATGVQIVTLKDIRSYFKL